MKSFFLFFFKIKFRKNSHEIYVFWEKRIEYVQAYPYAYSMYSIKDEKTKIVSLKVKVVYYTELDGVFDFHLKFLKRTTCCVLFLLVSLNIHRTSYIHMSWVVVPCLL